MSRFQGSFIFLPRSLKIFHFPVKTFEDLVWISKDLDKNFKDPLKIFENSLRIFQILVKIFEDLSFSCQDLQGSFTFLPRSWTILAGKFWRFVKMKDPWRFWKFIFYPTHFLIIVSWPRPGEVKYDRYLGFLVMENYLVVLNRVNSYLETKLPSEKQVEGGSRGGGVQTFGICIFLFLLLPWPSLLITNFISPIKFHFAKLDFAPSRVIYL